jgi:DNA-directed RNA polymerase
MFKLDLKEILEYFKKNDYSIFINNESKDLITFKYYKGEVKQKEIKIDGKRFTYQNKILNKNQLDDRKIRSSIKANYIHTIDAALAR